MALTKRQFDILAALAGAGECGKKITQRELCTASGSSLGTVNRALRELEAAGDVAGGRITQHGFETLEPYRAKRAIFIAAGFGTRLVPVTLNTPKPLVRVNGRRIIDTAIDACLAAGIDDIYIVRGYLAEQFDQLLYKYPTVKFIDNPSYNEANNISSAMAARHLMSGSYVFEADLLVTEPSIITKYHYQSDVLGIYSERTDDWCMTADKDGCLDEEMIGGRNCYRMIGIYYISPSDGKLLADDIAAAYAEPGGRERFWETVPNQVFRGKYRILIRECTDDDVTEIDTFRELKAVDPAYDV